MAYLGTPIDTTNQFQSLQGKRFNGDGSTTAFTLDIAPSSVFDIEVFVENVRQDPNSAYSISGTTLTFTGAPPSGTNNIYVVHQAKAVGTIEVLDGAITTAKLGADAVTEAKIADDAVESEHLNDNIISGQTALAATPADTDEFLISDGGTIKRIDYSYIKAANTPSFQATMSGNQTISASTETKIQFDTESFDTDSAYDHSTNYRFTVPSGKGGKYFVNLTAHTSVGNNTFDGIRVGTFINGSFSTIGFFTRRFNDSNTRTISASGILTLSASDYVEAYVFIENGTTVYSSVSYGVSNFSMYKLIGA